MKLGHENTNSDLLDTFQTIFSNENHRDMVFTCVDGTISFHSSIISRVSPLLKGLIDSISFHQSNLIFISLDNIHLLTLKTLMDCIYTGSSCIVDPNILDHVEDLAVLLEIEIDLFIELNNHASFIEDELNGRINAENEGESMENSIYGFDIKPKLHHKVEESFIHSDDQMIETINRDDKATSKTKRKHSSESIPIDIVDFTEFKNYTLLENNLQILEPKEISISNINKETSNTQKLVSVGDRQLICSMCDKQYTKLKLLRRHNRTAHEGVKYPCDQCDVKPFSGLNGLKYHKASFHEGVRYPCDQCGVIPFSFQNGLKKHKALVHEGIRYPCDQCDVKPYKYLKDLRRHKAIVHEGVRYPCDQCDVTQFSFQSGLRQHKASFHEGIRYPCEQCDVKPFSRPEMLREHKATVHEGVRYPCDQCDVKPYKYSKDLRRHKAIVHEGVRYECNKCDYKSSRKQHLKLHSKKYHNATTKGAHEDETMEKSTNYFDIKESYFSRAEVSFVPRDVIEPIPLEDKIHEDDQNIDVGDDQNIDENVIQRQSKSTSKTGRKRQIKPKPKVAKKRPNYTTKNITEVLLDTDMKYKRYNNEDKLIQSPYELESSDILEDIGYDMFHRFASKTYLIRHDEILLSKRLKMLHERNPDQIMLYNKLALENTYKYSSEQMLNANRLPGLIIDGKITNLTVCIGCGLVLKYRSSKKHLLNCPNNGSFLTHKKIEMVKVKINFTNLSKEDNVKLKCKLCNEVYEEVILLKDHYETLHPEFKRSSLCDLCGKSFGLRKRSDIAQHMFQKHGIEDSVPFQCDQCNDRFHQVSLLKRHIYDRHSKERPFSCEICGKTFRRKIKLNRHLLIHSEVKPWQCQHCEKAFTVEWTLKQHERIHLGIKPYKCTICKSGFSQRNSLNWHMKTHK